MDVKIYSDRDFPTYLPKLNNLYDELFTGGKGFRAKLVGRVARHLQATEKQVVLLAQTIEFIHNASLLHDDLVDRSPLRRGKKSAWLKYTPEYAVLAGDYLLARVMVNLSEYGKVELIHYTAQMISDLLEGEWIQDSLVGDFEVSASQLEQVHELKTASLFKWCLLAPFIALEKGNATTRKLLEEMGRILGLLFQRSDDLLDFDIRNYEGKAILGDLKSGYLNSFSVELRDQLSADLKEKFYNSKSLEEVKSVIGQSSFEKVQELFDQKNKTNIDLYLHYCDELESQLDPSEVLLIQDLRSLPGILYWRKK